MRDKIRSARRNRTLLVEEGDHDIMANSDHDINVINTKALCASPATTKSESHSNRNGTISKPEEHDDIISPVSFSNRGGLRRIIAPSGRDKQLMRQVSGLDLNDFDKVEGDGAEDGIILTGCAADIGGIIAPTPQQRQLMRQVSGLGLEDPIFGKNLHLDDSINKEHASFFFDDMDINDIPEDMRDMFSLASDRTDVVEADEVQSLDSKSMGSLPPLGLEEAPTSPKMKKIRKGKKPRRKSKDLSVTSDPMYVPPAPVFESKSKHRRRGSGADLSEASHHDKSYHDKKLAVDKALAAQVDAILNFSTHSRGGGSGHSRGSFGHNTNHSRVLKKGTRPKPLKQDSRFSTHSRSAYSTHSRGGAYVPSSMQESQSQRGERHLPDSMDQIFSGNKPTTVRRVRKKKSTRSTEEKKKKKKVKSKSIKSVAHDPDFEVS